MAGAVAWGASGYYRRALWSQIRNPKPETNSNAQWPKAQDRQQGSGFDHSLLGAWGLFRASSFGFRVSALWMAVVPKCVPLPGTLSASGKTQCSVLPLRDCEVQLFFNKRCNHSGFRDPRGVATGPPPWLLRCTAIGTPGTAARTKTTGRMQKAAGARLFHA